MENIIYFFLKVIWSLLISYQIILSIWEILGGMGSFLGGVAALGALYYAWKGFKKIESELVDQRDQINELTNVARELKDQNDINRERLRFGAMPQINAVPNEKSYSTVEVHKHKSFHYSITNKGMVAYELEVISFGEDGKLLMSQSRPLFEKNDKFDLIVDLGDRPEEFKGREFWLYYRDWLHNWYKQKVYFPTVFSDIQNFPPEPIAIGDHPHNHIYNFLYD